MFSPDSFRIRLYPSDESGLAPIQPKAQLFSELTPAFLTDRTLYGLRIVPLQDPKAIIA